MITNRDIITNAQAGSTYTCHLTICMYFILALICSLVEQVDGRLLQPNSIIYS